MLVHKFTNQIRQYLCITSPKTRLLGTITMGKRLAAFDFDHTIVDDNSDIVVRNLISKELIPDSVKKLYKTDGWTAYMQGVFKTLYKHKIMEINIKKAMQNIPAIPGMIKLIKKMSEELNYDIIIISDSNSYLINAWLEKHNLKNNIVEIFTNPAYFESGLLKVDMYHLQTECKLSTKNLCKGRILEEFIQIQKEKGITYEKIVYSGDGNNDFCPILRLNKHDLACVRNKYACQQLVNNTLEGKPIPITGETYTIQAEILVWNNGDDILKAIVTN